MSILNLVPRVFFRFLVALVAEEARSFHFISLWIVIWTWPFFLSEVALCCHFISNRIVAIMWLVSKTKCHLVKTKVRIQRTCAMRTIIQSLDFRNFRESTATITSTNAVLVQIHFEGIGIFMRESVSYVWILVPLALFQLLFSLFRERNYFEVRIYACAEQF